MTIAKDTVVAVIGLGYVGLPLAVEFGKKYKTIGFDLSEYKISSYNQHRDPTGEISTADLKAAMRPNGLEVTTDPIHLASADFLIVAVPTPVDKAHIPDFSALIGASATAGRHMKVGATVIFESTVYPGATEEVCIPVLEKVSGLRWKKDFHVGYSPERINPGDRERTVTKIVKVVSGDDADTLKAIGNLYESVITAGIHRASSIQVAEAAKVIENTQRDLNIALINELAIIFDKLGLDTDEVLQVAGTKWNFLPFRPGFEKWLRLSEQLSPIYKLTAGGLPKVQSCPRRRWSLATNQPTRWATRGTTGISFYAASFMCGKSAKYFSSGVSRSRLE